MGRTLQQMVLAIATGAAIAALAAPSGRGAGCAFPQNGLCSGTLLTTTTIGGITNPVVGTSISSPDGAKAFIGLGGSTPATAPAGVIVQLYDITPSGSTANLVWWSDVPTCTNMTGAGALPAALTGRRPPSPHSMSSLAAPVPFTTANICGVGAGFQMSEFLGTASYGGRAAEQWGSIFNETLIIDPTTCTPMFTMSTFVTDAAGNNIWAGAAIVNVTATGSSDPTLYTPPSRCFAV